MKWKSLLLYGLLLLLGISTSSFITREPSGNKFTISINVTNIRNTKGTMQFQLYRSQKTFAAETPYKIYRISKKSVKNKTLHFTISNLVAGHYGVALLDDENSNKKMDYGWVMPKEGFGFSDYYHTGWSKPTFYKFKFYLKADKSVVMKIRYL